VAPVEVRDGKLQLSVMLKQLPTAASNGSQSSSSSCDSKSAAVLSNEVCAQLFYMCAAAVSQVSEVQVS
jgi:hypothetical protein